MSEDIAYRDLPRAQPYHPSTFIERGVAVPFTTPLLDGTRARPGARDSVELVVPTLSGGPGVYIVPSSGVRLFCRVTVHDARLNQKIASLPSVTPMAIRSAARAVAAEGLAGDEAMVAARAIDEADRCEQLLTNFQLLMALLDEVEPNRHAGLQNTGRYTHELEQYARRAVVDVAAKIGQPAEIIAEVLEALAGILVAIGLRRQTVPARVPRLLQLLRRVSAEVADWSQLHVTEALQSYADVVCTVAGVTVSCAAATLQDAQALSDNVSDLMRRWTHEPAEIARLAARSEWLLDGWERICLIWTIAADDAARRAALVEMAQLAPALPREVADWAPVPFGADTPLPLRRTVRLNEDWRTGATVFHLIARNEHLLALAA